MSKKNIFLFLTNCFVIIAVLLIIWLCIKPKTGYVEVTKLYSEFELKKELETKLLKVTNSRKSILDSLELQLQLLSKQVQSQNGKDKETLDKFQLNKGYYLKKKQEFEEDNQALIKQYDQQIFKQLNQYVQDYGKKNDYKYIYGTDGNGNIMYADDTENITSPVSVFINKRYKGIVE